MTKIDRKDLPHSLRTVIDDFEFESIIRIWMAYPGITPDELQRTFEAGGESKSVSEAFAKNLITRSADLDVFLVYGDASNRYSAGGDHWWVRIALPDQRELNVDWTARQFHNLEQPHAPQHQDLPCPLIWESDRPGEPVHPVTGTYAVLLTHEIEVDGPRGDVRDESTGLPRVLSRKCDTCIFRPGNLMHLAPGQRDQMVREALAVGGWIVCHETLSVTGKPVGAQAICRGFWDIHSVEALGCRLTLALGGPIETPPPTASKPARG